jgi:hypothetical protein
MPGMKVDLAAAAFFSRYDPMSFENPARHSCRMESGNEVAAPRRLLGLESAGQVLTVTLSPNEGRSGIVQKTGADDKGLREAVGLCSHIRGEATAIVAEEPLEVGRS